MRIHHALRAASGYESASGITSPTHPDLIAMYTMDNISGSTLVDETGNGNDATLNGPTVVSGKIGNALNFDGSNDYTQASAYPNSQLQSLGYCFWLKLDSFTSFQTILNHQWVTGGPGATKNSGCGVRLRDLGSGDFRIAAVYNLLNDETVTNSLGFTYTDYSGQCYSSFTPVIGQWYFVCHNIIGGNSAELWIDNVLECTVSTTQSTRYTSQGASNGEMMGAVRAANGELITSVAHDGQNDQFRFFNRELTSSEIAELYNETSSSSGGGGSNLFALSFDGTVNSYISFPNTVVNGIENFTIEFWVNPSSTSRSEGWVSMANSTYDNQLLFFVDSSSGEFRIFVGTDSSIVSTTGFDQSGFVHFAVTRNAGTGVQEVFKNGVSQGTVTLGTGPLTVDPNGFVWGQEQDSVGGGFDGTQAYTGQMADLRVWSVVRTQSEIQNNANATLTGSETGLVAYYPTDSGSGTTLVDNAGTNDGTINGASWVVRSAFPQI